MTWEKSGSPSGKGKFERNTKMLCRCVWLISFLFSFFLSFLILSFLRKKVALLTSCELNANILFTLLLVWKSFGGLVGQPIALLRWINAAFLCECKCVVKLIDEQKFKGELLFSCLVLNEILTRSLCKGKFSLIFLTVDIFCYVCDARTHVWRATWMIKQLENFFIVYFVAALKSLEWEKQGSSSNFKCA